MKLKITFAEYNFSLSSKRVVSIFQAISTTLVPDVPAGIKCSNFYLKQRNGTSESACGISVTAWKAGCTHTFVSVSACVTHLPPGCDLRPDGLHLTRLGPLVKLEQRDTGA